MTDRSSGTRRPSGGGVERRGHLVAHAGRSGGRAGSRCARRSSPAVVGGRRRSTSPGRGRRGARVAGEAASVTVLPVPGGGGRRRSPGAGGRADEVAAASAAPPPRRCRRRSSVGRPSSTTTGSRRSSTIARRSSSRASQWATNPSTTAGGRRRGRVLAAERDQDERDAGLVAGLGDAAQHQQGRGVGQATGDFSISPRPRPAAAQRLARGSGRRSRAGGGGEIALAARRSAGRAVVGVGDGRGHAERLGDVVSVTGPCASVVDLMISLRFKIQGTRQALQCGSTRRRFPASTTPSSDARARHAVPAPPGTTSAATARRRPYAWRRADAPGVQALREPDVRQRRHGAQVRPRPAPDAPWRCPENCPKYERRLAAVAWTQGSLVAPPTPAEPPSVADGTAAALLDEAEDHLNSVGDRGPRSRPSGARPARRAGGGFFPGLTSDGAREFPLRGSRIPSDAGVHPRAARLRRRSRRPGRRRRAGGRRRAADPGRGDLALQPHRGARPRPVPARRGTDDGRGGGDSSSRRRRRAPVVDRRRARRLRRAQRGVRHAAVVVRVAGRTVVDRADRRHPRRRRRRARPLPAPRHRRRRGQRGHRRRAVHVRRRRRRARRPGGPGARGARPPGSATSASTSSPTAWQIGHQQAVGDRDSTSTLATVALGGHYARCAPRPASSAPAGAPARSPCTSPAASRCTTSARSRTTTPRTRRATCCSRAPCRTSRAASTPGLIKIRKHARGTSAFQTNRNLTLSEGAWAESVPNLEIETNDVRCSHASTVGPIDAEQRFYLESRGIPTQIAERLIVLGFFDEVLDQLPSAPLAERAAPAGLGQARPRPHADGVA